jgi:hypothetical protein
LVSILITVSSLDDAFIDLLALGILRFRVPGLVERAHAIPNILAVGEACACPRWVSTSIRANSCHAANGSEVLLQRPFY